MRAALRLAEKGWGRTFPNPMVGAILVKDGKNVGEGYHAGFGEDHAEVAALRMAGERAKGATLFATLEPCNHQGHTPPCSSAIIAADVARVVIAVRDPNPIAGGGMERLRDAGIAVDDGIELLRARELNAPFFNSFRSDRPWITLKLAMSLDGAIADSARSPGWLTSARARNMVHRMRAGVDAVGVGLGTVLADNPALTARGSTKPRVAPVRIVFSRSGALPPDSVLATTTERAPTWLVASTHGVPEAEKLQEQGVRIIAASDLHEAVRILASQGITSLLIEGGAQIAAAFLDGGLVDRLTIFRAPLILGSGSLNAFAGVRPGVVADALRMPVVETKLLGADGMTTYALSSL